ncbi:BTAD domain-containing putative transcriptional regulator [Sphaerisporangium sp. NPDC005288]|uniref:BTAD domain-containing putative transcriptional regulator n=1 Tax=Sphaerisporangium sp. NPDC005288 TaxID=3155114 RepID=UPI0033B03D9D
MAVPVGAAGSGGEAGSASGGSLRLQLLGPLRMWRGDVELDAGPPQQALLLALLLARAGRPISTSRLVELIWEDAPASAVNLIHKYIGTLRRLLEPTVPIRGTGSHLQRRGNGYLFVAGNAMLDLAVFRELVQDAETALTQHRPEAPDRYVEALGLWQGSAGDGLTHGPAAISIFAGLHDEFYAACVAAADLAESLGRPERVLPSLRLAASMAPLHELVHARLVSTLRAAGQQAQALDVFRTARTCLADELGIDPGPALRAAHQRVLVGGTAPAAGARPLVRPRAPWQAAAPSGRRPAGGLVGRAEELAVLRQAVRSALDGGRGFVIVDGEPGVGKTRLLEEIAAEAGQRGAFVVWGRCLEGAGTPSMWPWVKAIGTVLDALPAETRDRWQAGVIGGLLRRRDDDLVAPAMLDGGRFRLFEEVVAVFREASALWRTLLVIDDLQWADDASLHLFSHLADQLPEGTMIVGALRDRAPAPGTDLSRMLAAASRVSGHRRVHLGPLSPPEVAELVRGETGRLPGPGAARGIHARTAGNPFFVRELSRLPACQGPLTEDAVALTEVPSTVHDVVRDRMTGLGADTRDLLRIAALIGREVHLNLLARAAGLDVRACLDHLEPLEALGLMESALEDPCAYRFAHDLVRQSVAETIPRRRAAQLHLDVAEALERAEPGDDSVAERLAYHLWAAGPLADPARTVRAQVLAGRRAAAKSAFDAAERDLRMAARNPANSRSTTDHRA